MNLNILVIDFASPVGKSLGQLFVVIISSYDGLQPVLLLPFSTPEYLTCLAPGNKSFINGVGISVHYQIRLTLHKINVGNPTQLWFFYYCFCVSMVIDITWLYLRCTYFSNTHPHPSPPKIETKTLVYAVHEPFT